MFVFPEFTKAIYTDDTTGKCLPYRLYVPEDYDKAKQYPVFFFLHGAGERGDDNATHIRVLENAYRVAGDMLGQAIVLSPQCPADCWWDLNTQEGDENGWLGAAIRLLRTTMAQYRCDKSRGWAFHRRLCHMVGIGALRRAVCRRRADLRLGQQRHG